MNPAPADAFLLFVYGTLMRGGVRHRLLADQRFLGEARTLPQYALHDFGAYPGMVCRGDGAAVSGELYEVAVSRIPELDAEEGASALFRLESVAVDGCDGPAFAYLYQRSVEGALRRPGGRWFQGRWAMTHDQAFLRAICEAPDDDAPRLVYADWLEERGYLRGEFIRVQCMYARLAPPDTGADENATRAWKKLLEANLQEIAEACNLLAGTRAWSWTGLARRELAGLDGPATRPRRHQPVAARRGPAGYPPPLRTRQVLAGSSIAWPSTRRPRGRTARGGSPLRCSAGSVDGAGRGSLRRPYRP